MQKKNASKWIDAIVRLSDDQEKLIKGNLFDNGNNLGIIYGPAGSGKTIILVYALAEKYKKETVAFISYTHSLLNLASQGLPSNVKKLTYLEAIKSSVNYDFIVIDEVQDIPLDALKELIKKSKKVLLAGDQFQKIYKNGCSATDLDKLVNYNSKKLTKTYRLTPTAFAAASKINPGSLEGAETSGKTVVPIELYITDSLSEGNELCYKEAKKKILLNKTVAILLPTKPSIINFANQILSSENKPLWSINWKNGKFPIQDFESLNNHLKSHNINLQIVQNGFGNLNDAFENNQVVLQTYHSAKGLDYEYVFLPNLNVEDSSKDTSLYKFIFFVAITRASGAMIITQVKGKITYFVNQIKEFCVLGDLTRLNNTNNNDDEF